MSKEEVGPDFDIGIDAGDGIENAWQSQSSDKASSPCQEDSIDTPDELEERVGRDTQDQLQRLLKISEASGISEVANAAWNAPVGPGRDLELYREVGEK